MSAINGMRIKNLRSLKDTDELPIKRLNLLVGRNSGGKSTYARILPLIRQSTEVRKRSPILWYGRLVDFGSFQDSVRDSDSTNEIQLSFRLALDKIKKIGASITSTASDYTTYDVLAAITLKGEKNSGETTVSRLDLTFEGVECKLSFSDGKLQTIEVDDLLELVNPTLHQQITFTGLLPNINTFKYQKVKVGDQEFRLPSDVDVFVGPLARDITAMTRSNIAPENIDAMIDRYSYGTDQEILAQLKGQIDGPQKWVNFCRNVGRKEIGFKRTRNAILMANLPNLINVIDETISSLAKNVRYLEPLRATAQRYYRRQELAVDELDSRGENVPFFLDNLDNYQKKILAAWLNRHFGISVETESTGGHIAIRLKIAGSKKAVNLADTGFGYSQVLPIALQLWSLTQGSYANRLASDRHDQKLVVIEQPELHLHPALQAKLGDIFAACIAEQRDYYTPHAPDLRITVETHSPSLINRIGELISLGKIDADHVQVILFEKDEGTGVTTTRVSKYGKDGRLQNWPYGFFEAIDEDSSEHLKES